MPNLKNNKRKSNRVSLTSANAKISGPKGLFAFFKGSPKAAPIVDISMEGIRLLFYEKLANDKKVAMSVIIPALSSKPLKMEGQVIWTQKFKPFEMYLTGIKITSILPVYKERLNHLVSFLGDKSRKITSIGVSKFKARQLCKICQFTKDIGQTSIGFSMVNSRNIGNN